MQCQNCENTVKYVIPIIVQIYDHDGLENGVSNEYWCLNCLENVNDLVDDSIGVDVSDGKE